MVAFGMKKSNFILISKLLYTDLILLFLLHFFSFILTYVKFTYAVR